MTENTYLRLILMRHAKSSWDDPCMDDHDRPLNGRGRKSATAVGKWLRTHGYVPDQILSSTAQRTVETAHGLGLNDVPTHLIPPLYMAGPDRILAQLHRAQGRCILMLGHNPGIGWLAEMLVRAPPLHGQFGDYPTGATLVLDFEAIEWATVSRGTGIVAAFITPRELTD
ncbi:histidine phosphatase family protein [Roseovarius aestuarii]|nr:histidine phosphatase family protein [Roseovarius aestuarii]